MGQKTGLPQFTDTPTGQRSVCGIGTLDGSNPTKILHGFETALGAQLQLIGSSAPGDGTSELTYVVNGDYIDVYAWAAVSGTDPTLAASTGTETFFYQFFGS